ncbi:MAG TPA: HPr family phosphocarrier protein [Candidatus Cloacimonadota bacterium]|nr:HPr family phosphocarrier protein [Candidatus Cloacimonadota bacterium]HOV17083.1 HPr family phosphocarrier protein [Candidatus Cloacimonadota bacterium]HQL14993.1 HPr family phosphocarrier protein [Candidatus Cloacimonadota bacterium]
MVAKEITVENKLGLHARPAAMLVKAATKYRSDFFIEKEGMKVNGKSIMGVMMLAAEYKSKLTLIADGVDEDYLIEEIVSMFKSKFNEE